MPRIIGTYEHTIDNKGRVSFPAKVRKYLNPECDDNFTIIRGTLKNRCLFLYPEDYWIVFEEKLLNGRSNVVEPSASSIREVFRHSEKLSLDNQNRVMIPSKLAEWAGISDKVTMIGMGDHLELWAPDVLEVADENLTHDDYVENFAQLFGDAGK